MVKVKICGITNLEDALAAVEAGADALGFNFYSKSPRCVDPEKVSKIVRSLPPFILKVGIFVNENPDKIEEIMRKTGMDLVQLHGDESPHDCERFGRKAVKALRARQKQDEALGYPSVSALLLDTFQEGSYGGTGKSFDWGLAEPFKKAAKPIILSGGLDPDNVTDAIRKVRPYAVDACSLLEDKPGKKNHERVRLFIKRAKELDMDHE